MEKQVSNTNVELNLISEVLKVRDLNTVIENGVSQKHFTGRYKEGFKYIQKHSSKYGKVISGKIFQKEFPDIPILTETEEPLKFWCDAIVQKRKHNLIVDKLEETFSLVEELKTEEAFNKLKGLVLQVESEIQSSDRQAINKNTKSRKEDYRARQVSGGITGIPTAINEWDKLTGGDNKGELHTYMAYTGVGKTWWLVVNAVHQAKDGYKILLITTEMSTKLMMRRIDAVWCSLNYTRFKKGQLLPEEEKRFYNYLEDMEGQEDTSLEVVQATGGITQVSAEIDRAEPDVVYIDGAYLLEDEEYGEDNWSGVLRIWRGLHKLCLAKDVPIKVTTQSKDETNAKLSSLAFAKAISNECMPKDTLVLTDKGYRRIQDLVNTKFNVFDGFKTKQALCVETGMKRVLQINYLGNEFECSPNHLVGVYDNIQGNFIFKKAKDIKAGTDYLVQYSNRVNGEGYLPEVNISRGRVKIPKSLEATEELGRFLGYMVGDGSLKPFEKGQIRLSSGITDSMAKEAINIVEKVFGIKGKISSNNNGVGNKTQYVATWYSRGLSDWLKYFIVDNMGNKFINPELIQMNINFRQGLVAGLIQSDGCISKGNLSFGTVDSKLAQGISLLFNSFGCLSKIYKSRVSSNLSRSPFLYKISIRKWDIPKLSNLTLLDHKRIRFNSLKFKTINGSSYIPEQYIKYICSKLDSKDFRDRKYNALFCSARHSKSCSIETLREFELKAKVFNMQNFHFMPIDSIITTDSYVNMYDVKVTNSSDKSLIANGIVTHNCDIVAVLEQDDQMKNDREVKLKPLKLREGDILVSIVLNWDFNEMNYSPIYKEDIQKEANVDEVDGVIVIDEEE